MKSLVILSYKQPHKTESKIRVGVVLGNRDTYRLPIDRKTTYRWRELCRGTFRRSRNLLTVQERQGVRSFYAERCNWRITIPFLGSILSPLFR